MWHDKLKEAGINLHVIATGGGAGLQNELWEIPGCSAYLSGASFPYAQEEQRDLLGFMPEHFCSEEAAVDLASAAYMKAYRFGGKKPVGLGIAASVASEKVHRGEHRIFTCVMTDDKVMTLCHVLEKGAGAFQRGLDGKLCDDTGFWTLMDTLSIAEDGQSRLEYKDATDLAKARFFGRPYFTADGNRYTKFDNINHALMPGAYNPPHDGHLGMADAFESVYGSKVVFNITTNPPHKEELSVQDCLKRARLLHGRDRLFTRNDPLYLDKARNNPNTAMLIGADALIRMLDPKWGVEIKPLLQEFKDLGTKFYVSGRTIDGKFINGWDAVCTMPDDLYVGYSSLFVEMDGRWDISSTALRNEVIK